MKFLKSKISPSLINMLVLTVCVVSANTRCCWIFHQLKMPEGMKNFKRF